MVDFRFGYKVHLDFSPSLTVGLLTRLRYGFNLPVSISASIFQSPMKDQSGCLKVAGRFFSIKKCAVQANA